MTSTLTAEETETIAAADHILKAPPAWIEAEPPYCLLEILEVVIEHLNQIREPGISRRVVQLELLKGATAKRLLLQQQPTML